MSQRRRNQTSPLFERPTQSRDKNYGRTSKDVVANPHTASPKGGQS